MSSLTLEQVLARSMRLPRRRARQSIAAVFGSSSCSNPPLSQPSPTTAASTAEASLASLRSEATDAHHIPRRKRVQGDLAAFFKLVEQQDAAKAAQHPNFRRGGPRLVQSSADLLTDLQGAQRVGSWEDALFVFTRSTHTAVAGDPPAVVPAEGAAPDGTVSPRAEHVLALVDTCAAAHQWALVEALGRRYGAALPAVLARVVGLLAGEQSQPPGVAADHPQWRAAFHYLQHCGVPPAERGVESYNAVLTACERRRDWAGALEVVRAMGPSPLRGWRSAAEGPSAATTAEEGGAPNAAASERLSEPPSPDVVSYATLIATLEQAGKDKLAAEVLNRLPPLEKEEITASYAALIHVWSKQIYKKQNRRF